MDVSRREFLGASVAVASGAMKIDPARSAPADPPAKETTPVKPPQTWYQNADRRRYLLCPADFQKDMPNIPVEGIEIRLRLPGANLWHIVRVPDSRQIDHQRREDVVTFTAPRLETLAMFALETA